MAVKHMNPKLHWSSGPIASAASHCVRIIPILSTPPDARTSHIVDQLESEHISIPGSKVVFPILASAKQTNGGIVVFTSGAHDIFLVAKGNLKLWNGDKCRVMGPGDFAYVPPKARHNPKMVGPHTEILRLTAPDDWVDFFRRHIVPKVTAAKDRFDVHFVFRGGRGEGGGGISRPFITAAHCGGRFAISSIERSNTYQDDRKRTLGERWLTFPTVDHCLVIFERLLKVRLKGRDEWTAVREGQTLTIAAGQTFALEFASCYVRAISLTNGRRMEELIQTAGSSFAGFVFPDEPVSWDEARRQEDPEEIGVQLGDYL
ncbi:putative cupin domain-protein [Achaetomium macrosporum]|uniref:Cupin domain-protein n=1 Tax=Achaetomium macrosporum TaxID=79813 RepID=A0AAN7C7A9_9PEZI|nr:putative cupin domain-protein [Achaetomium macrosporum]